MTEEPMIDADQMKYYLDKLRAEASRGQVSSSEIFKLTDPLMDMLMRILSALPTKPATPASGEQMEVVAWRFEIANAVSHDVTTGEKEYVNWVRHVRDYPPHAGDGQRNVEPLVTLAAAQREVAEADANAEAWGKALKAAEALNTTLSEALERIAQRKGKISSHQCQIIARAALRKSQGERT